jgi:hypothetical protein
MRSDSGSHDSDDRPGVSSCRNSSHCLIPGCPRRDVDAYYKMAETGILKHADSVELIDGKIIDIPATGSAHVGKVSRLARLFTRARGRCDRARRRPRSAAPRRLQRARARSRDPGLARTPMKRAIRVRPTSGFSSKSPTVRSPMAEAGSSRSTRNSRFPRSGSMQWRAKRANRRPTADAELGNCVALSSRPVPM